RDGGAALAVDGAGKRGANRDQSMGVANVGPGKERIARGPFAFPAAVFEQQLRRATRPFGSELEAPLRGAMFDVDVRTERFETAPRVERGVHPAANLHRSVG